MKFKTYFLLAERINKTDIIDLYILMSMPTPDDAGDAFVADEIAKKTKNNIQSEIEGILLRELRHIEDEVDWEWDPSHRHIHEFGSGSVPSSIAHIKAILRGDPDYKKVKQILEDEARKIFNQSMSAAEYLHGITKTEHYLKSKYEEESSDAYDEGEVTISELANATGLPWDINSVINAFRYLPWASGYGGDNWADIAAQAKGLIEAGPDDMFKKLDRFIDYVHNSGPVLNKFYGYKKGWFQFILDLKAQSLNIRELIPYASRDVQRMFRDQAWRWALMNQPGLGAEDSTDVIRPLLFKYMKALTNDISKTRYIIKSIGRNGIIGLFQHYPVNDIIKYADPHDEQFVNILKELAAAIDHWRRPEYTPEEYFSEYFDMFMSEVPREFVKHLNNILNSKQSFTNYYT